MKHRLTALSALTALLIAVPAFAVEAQPQAGSNFVSGNPNNDGEYKPRKVRQMKSNDPNRAPGFWDKEWERSGLNKTVGGAWWSPFSKTGNYFKKKEEAYRAKNPAVADR
jgi:hypothetical protein